MGALCSGALVRATRGEFVKVLHVIPSVAARDGGPSRAVIEMCQALRRNGVETLIATTDADGPDQLDVATGQPTSYRETPVIFFHRQATESFKYSRSLAQWLDQHIADFDLVHIHAVFSHASMAAAKACRKKDVPYIVRPLGTLDPWSLKQKQWKKDLFWHLGVKQMLHQADAIHYTTVGEKEAAEASLGLKRGVVVPLGIDETLLIGTREEEAPLWIGPYILVLSRLHPKKGLEVLVRAFLSVVQKPEFESWNLLLAGEGEAGYVSSLKNLVKTNGGNGNVVFTGWLEGDKRDNTLRHASLLALTSYQENFGLCVVEALGCGVPVLLSPHVNIADDVERAGAGWVSPVNIAALEQALTDSLRDQNERTKRGRAGQKFVREQFNWDSIAGNLTKLYYRLQA